MINTLAYSRTFVLVQDPRVNPTKNTKVVTKLASFALQESLMDGLAYCASYVRKGIYSIGLCLL